MSIHHTVHSEAHQAGPPSAQSHAMFHPVLDPALISCHLVFLFQHLFPPAACLRAFYLVVSCLHSDPDPVKHDKYLFLGLSNLRYMAFTRFQANFRPVENLYV